MAGSTESWVEVPGTVRDPLVEAADSGRWPEEDRIDVSILLRRSPSADSLSSMDELGSRPIARRQYLTREEFGARHSASSADIERVQEFARRYDLTLDEAQAVRRVVRLHGRASDVGRAFGTDLRRFSHPFTPYRGHRGPVRIPRDLAGIVVGVFGLDSRPQLRPHFRRNADPSAVGYSALTVAQAYSFPSGLTGAGGCVALLEFGGGFASTDLQTFFESLGMPTPNVVTVGVDGASNAPTGDPSGPDAEVELDIEIVGALAPAARIAVYFAPNTEQGFVDALTTAVHDPTNRPSVVSISWGNPEPSWSSAARSALESVVQEAATMGVTVLAASGDQGASDGEPPGVLTVDFPASSPYLVGCGGTRLELSGTTIVSEVVWNDLSEGEGATGGGVSEDFSMPSYQADAEVPDAPNGFAGRGVPDVAADADPDTGYAVFIDGQSAVLGGTSAVAPLWAALIARIGQALGKPLGYVNPLLYPAPASSTFHEITSGDNDGYSAGPGWNACTGLGSPQGTNLLTALRS